MPFEFTPPPKLSELSARSLSSVDDGVLEFALITHLRHHVAGTGDLEGMSRWPAPLRHWYVAFTVDGEVLNGGFNQFFFNPSGELAPAAPEAFRALGVPDAAALVERAIALLAQHAPALETASDQGTVEAFMETYIDQPFAQLDEAYAAIESDLRDARIRYVRSNAASFANARGTT